MDFFVDLAVNLGNWYTAGMLVIPLSLLGWSIKLFAEAGKEKASPLGSPLGWLLVAAAIGVSVVAIPSYFEARERCHALVDQGVSISQPGTGGFRTDPVTGEVTYQPPAYNPRFGQYLEQDCQRLLSW